VTFYPGVWNPEGPPALLPEPDLVCPLKMMCEGVVIPCCGRPGKFTEHEIKFRKTGDTIELWTTPTRKFDLLCCVPVRDAEGQPVHGKYIDLTRGIAVFGGLESAFDDSKGWYGAPLDYWKTSGVSRPLGYKRNVYIDVDYMWMRDMQDIIFV
jgi:hypothetical protein